MRLLLAGNSSNVTVIDTSTWDEVSTGINPGLGNINSVIYIGRKNAFAISGTSSPYFRVYSLDDYSEIATSVTIPGSCYGQMVLSADGKTLYVPHDNSPYITVVDVDTWTEVSASPPTDITRIYGMALSPDGIHLAVGGSSNPIFYVTDIRDWSVVDSNSAGLPNTVYDLRFSPDGAFLYAASSNDALTKIDTSDWSFVDSVSENDDPRSVDVSADGSTLYTSYEFGPEIKVLNASDLSTTQNGNFNDTRRIRLSPTEKWVAVGFELQTNGSLNSGYWGVLDADTLEDATSGSTVDAGATVNDVAWIPDVSGVSDTSVPMQVHAYAGEEDPDGVSGGYATSVPMQPHDYEGYFTPDLYEPDMAVTVPMQAWGIDAQLEFRGDLAVTVPMQSHAYTGFPGPEFEQSLGVGSSISHVGLGFGFSSTFNLASSETLETAFFFISKMGAASSLDIKLKGGMTFSDAMSMADAESISHILELASTIGLGSADNINHLKAMLFISKMALDSSDDYTANYLVNFASAMTLHSLAAYGRPLDVTSVMDIASVFESRYNAVVDAVSTMAAASSEDMKYTATLAFISAFETESGMDTQANLHMDFEDLLGSYTVLKIGDDIFEGWVLSADDQAFTQYENYPFTSIASFRGKPYGVADDGLYLLEGDDDAGDPIQAALRTGFSAFGQRVLKDAKSAYIGYTSSGQMVLKVAVSKGGKKHEYWYQLKHGASDDMRTGRATIQRGLRSTYWQFELVNKDGADFEIDDVTIVYNILSRRIRR